MLLRPRKFKYKNIFKRRSLRFSKNLKKFNLRYGDIGLLILQPLRLNSKHIFRQKLLLKRGSRKYDITKRKIWFNIFPHVPLSRKVAGSRMGKGTGKLSGWITELPAGIFLFEYKNLRNGRANYYANQVISRLPVKTRLIRRYNSRTNLILTKTKQINTIKFW